MKNNIFNYKLKMSEEDWNEIKKLVTDINDETEVRVAIDIYFDYYKKQKS